MMKSPAISQIATVVGLLLLTVVPSFGRILVIHSYHEGYDWVQGINKGLAAHFKPDAPRRLFYMDTKRHPDEAWKKKAAAEAKSVIAEYRPRVVIAVDDNAQKYVVSSFVGRSRIQFVFCGVNADPNEYGYPAENVTGILERAYPQQVFQMLKKIMPTAENVAWVSDESATSDLLMPRVRKLADSGKLPLNITGYSRPVTFEQWQKTIAYYDKTPGIQALLIPLYHTVKSMTDDKSVQPSTVMRWTIAHTRKPILGFWPFSTDDGALCAVAVDPFEHGKVAALMANQILAGKKASDLPMLINKNGYVIINLKSANRLGIDVPFEVIQSADKVIE